MSNFKRQLDDIKIPESLHQRSLQGIQQAQKEQRKPRTWLPKVVASIVTFAAIGFIVLNVGERDTRQQQASILTEKKLVLTSVLLAYCYCTDVGICFCHKSCHTKGHESEVRHCFKCHHCINAR